MPDPDRLLSTYRRACEACTSVPGRVGRFVELHDATEVIVAGDLHGNLENFRGILRRADLERNPGRHLVLQEVIHGTVEYPQGGCRSHQLLDLCAALKVQYPTRFHLVPGNHEAAQFSGRRIIKDDRDLNTLYDQGIRRSYGTTADAVLAAQRDFCFALPVALRTANRVFLSHSLPARRRLAAFDSAVLMRDEVDESEWHPGGSLYALLWGRDVDDEHVAAFLSQVDADLLISGHIPCSEGFATPNGRQLILDSMGSKAATCLFRADGSISLADLIAGTSLL